MYIKISLHNTKGSHDLAMSLDTDPHFPKGYHDLTMSHVTISSLNFIFSDFLCKSLCVFLPDGHGSGPHCYLLVIRSRPLICSAVSIPQCRCTVVQVYSFLLIFNACMLNIADISPTSNAGNCTAAGKSLN